MTLFYEWLARFAVFGACAVPLLIILGFALAVEYPKWKEEQNQKKYGPDEEGAG